MTRQDPLYNSLMLMGVVIWGFMFIVVGFVALYENDSSLLLSLFGARFDRNQWEIVNIIGIIATVCFSIGFVLYLIELVKDINHTRELRTKRNLLRKEREDSDSDTDFTEIKF